MVRFCDETIIPVVLVQSTDFDMTLSAGCWCELLGADSGQQAGRCVNEVYAALHPLYQAQRDEAGERLGR